MGRLSSVWDMRDQPLADPVRTFWWPVYRPRRGLVTVRAGEEAVRGVVKAKAMAVVVIVPQGAITVGITRSIPTSATFQTTGTLEAEP